MYDIIHKYCCSPSRCTGSARWNVLYSEKKTTPIFWSPEIILGSVWHPHPVPYRTHSVVLALCGILNVMNDQVLDPPSIAYIHMSRLSKPKVAHRVFALPPRELPVFSVWTLRLPMTNRVGRTDPIELQNPPYTFAAPTPTYIKGSYSYFYFGLLRKLYWWSRLRHNQGRRVTT